METLFIRFIKERLMFLHGHGRSFDLLYFHRNFVTACNEIAVFSIRPMPDC